MPLEDGSVRSDASHLISGRLARLVARNTRLQFDIFNLLDSETSDIEYLYTSRLPHEPDAGVEGIHTHPAEPRSIRVALTFAF